MCKYSLTLLKIIKLWACSKCLDIFKLKIKKIISKLKAQKIQFFTFKNISKVCINRESKRPATFKIQSREMEYVVRYEAKRKP